MDYGNFFDVNEETRGWNFVLIQFQRLKTKTFICGSILSFIIVSIIFYNLMLCSSFMYYVLSCCFVHRQSLMFWPTYLDNMTTSYFGMINMFAANIKLVNVV